MTGMLTRNGSRVVVALAVGVAMVAGLAGCGEWSPWAEPAATGAPAQSVAPTETATATPAPTVTATPTPTVQSTPLGPLSGSWQGTWVNTAVTPGTGTFTLTWAQQGSRVVGAISVEGSNCLRNGNVDGTAIGTRIRFGAVQGSVTVEYDGTVVNSNTIEGTYTSACGDSRGTWTATRRAP
jgi:hypothetical protein